MSRRRGRTRGVWFPLCYPLQPTPAHGRGRTRGSAREHGDTISRGLPSHTLFPLARYLDCAGGAPDTVCERATPRAGTACAIEGQAQRCEYGGLPVAKAIPYRATTERSTLVHSISTKSPLSCEEFRSRCTPTRVESWVARTPTCAKAEFPTASVPNHARTGEFARARVRERRPRRTTRACPSANTVPIGGCRTKPRSPGLRKRSIYDPK